MRLNNCLLVCIVLISVVTGSHTQDMPPPSAEASILWTALCIHDNRIRESCLQNVHSKELINGLLLSLNTPLRLSERNDDDNTQKVAVPDKRMREQDQLSGFYSNW